MYTPVLFIFKLIKFMLEAVAQAPTKTVDTTT